MDQPVKTLVNSFIIFMGLFLLVSCLTFAMLSNNARDTLNAVTEYVEIKGYDNAVITNLANKTGTEIAVVPLTSNNGIATNGEKNRYEIQVSFKHVFAWLNLKNKITYSAITRAVDY